MSMSKSSMRVSSNSIAQFLNLLSKLRNRKFNPTGIGNEGDGLVAVKRLKLYISFTIYVLCAQKNRDETVL